MFRLGLPPQSNLLAYLYLWEIEAQVLLSDFKTIFLYAKENIMVNPKGISCRKFLPEIDERSHSVFLVAN